MRVNVLANCGTTRPLSLRLIDELCMESGTAPALLVSNVKLAQAYAEICRLDRRCDCEADATGLKCIYMGGEVRWEWFPECGPHDIWAIAPEDLPAFRANPKVWLRAAERDEAGSFGTTVLRDISDWISYPNEETRAMLVLADEMEKLRLAIEQRIPLIGAM